MCEVYGDNIMSDDMVKKLVRILNDGRNIVNDKALFCFTTVPSHTLHHYTQSQTHPLGGYKSTTSLTALT